MLTKWPDHLFICTEDEFHLSMGDDKYKNINISQTCTLDNLGIYIEP